MPCSDVHRQRTRPGADPTSGQVASRLLVIGILVATLGGCSLVDHYTGEDVNAGVRANGLDGRAEVLEVWDTGVRLNDNPVVGFRLLVSVGDEAPYEAEAKNVVSVVHIPQVQPGAVLPVKVDPVDRSLVALAIYDTSPDD